MKSSISLFEQKRTPCLAHIYFMNRWAPDSYVRATPLPSPTLFQFRPCPAPLPLCPRGPLGRRARDTSCPVSPVRGLDTNVFISAM